MGKLTKILVKKLSAKAKESFVENKEFFSKPANLIALGLVGVQLLNKLLERLKKKHKQLSQYNLEDDRELLKFLKADPLTKEILQYANNTLDENYLSEILLQCERGEFNTTEEDLLANLNSDDFLQAISSINDIDEKVDSNKFASLLSKINKLIDVALPFALLIIYIIKMTKDLLTKTEHPSRYRLKYIQKLIRTTIGLMKSKADEYKDQIDILKQIDTLLIGISLATFIYIRNRQILQKRSRETLRLAASEQACGVTLDEPIDIEIKRKPLVVPSNMDQFECPVDLDNTVIPKEPFESKQENFTCDVFEPTQEYKDADEKFGIATKAILRNLRSDKFVIILPVDSKVDIKTPVGTLAGTPVFSPVEGYIDSIQKNQVIIRDLNDTSDDFLNEQINLLAEKYARINDIKLFMNDYFIASQFPVMLSISTIDDASTNATKNVLKDVGPQFTIIQKQYEGIKKAYDKTIQDLTSEANVKKHSENETLDQIKDNIEKLQEKFYKDMRTLKGTAENISKITAAKPNEYILLEYYLFNLGQSLGEIDNPNDIQKTYIKGINDIITKRYLLDKYKLSDIEDKLNKLIKDMEKGVSLGNWFKKMMDVYNDAKKDKLNTVKDWLTDIANNNKKLDPLEKTAAVNKIMFLFKFYLEIKTSKYKLPKDLTSKSETIKEAAFIDNFFNGLWQEFDQIIKDIEIIVKTIDGLSLFSTYSITELNDEPHRLYVISDEPQCDLPDDMRGTTGAGYGSKKYWLRYCSFATLASVTNPATGWSTGLILPVGPVPFPVIYIPIKPIATKYGFIVIGLSICGIYFFPWVLFANLASAYNTPLGDPTRPLKNEVKALQNEIIDQLKNLKRGVIKIYLDETKKKLEEKTAQIETTKQTIKNNKASKPVKKPSSSGKEKLAYSKEYDQWVETGAKLKEFLLTLKMERWALEKKYKIVFEAYTIGASLKGSTENIEKKEQFINKQFDKLTVAMDKIDNILAPLPITMQPNTANFGITIKHPKPITKIADNLDDNINLTILDKIIKPFKLQNKDMMELNYESKLSNSVVNYKKYRATLLAASMQVIQKDPFPTYQNLKIANVPWVLFLYKDWVTTGAKQYGFPGFPPIAV